MFKGVTGKPQEIPGGHRGNSGALQRISGVLRGLLGASRGSWVTQGICGGFRGTAKALKGVLGGRRGGFQWVSDVLRDVSGGLRGTTAGLRVI